MTNTPENRSNSSPDEWPVPREIGIRVYENVSGDIVVSRGTEDDREAHSLVVIPVKHAYAVADAISNAALQILYEDDQ